MENTKEIGGDGEFSCGFEVVEGSAMVSTAWKLCISFMGHRKKLLKTLFERWGAGGRGEGRRERRGGKREEIEDNRKKENIKRGKREG